LEEDAARAHGYAVVVSSIDFPMLPTAVATVEVLEEAVSRATPWAQLNRVAAALLKGPYCPQVALATIRRFDVPARNQSFGCHGRAEAQRAPIGGVVRDLI
jgi:hypothetical protein